MTLAEFHAWREFHKHNPISDLARVYRPAALVAAAFGGKFDAALEFLLPKKPARPLKPVTVIRIPKE